MVAPKHILLLAVGVLASPGLPHVEPGSVVGDCFNIDQGFDVLNDFIKKYKADWFSAFGIVNAAEQLENIVSNAEDNARFLPVDLSPQDSKTVIDYVNDLTEPNVKRVMGELRKKKAGLVKDKLNVMVADSVGRLRDTLRMYSLKVSSRMHWDSQKVASKAAFAKIDRVVEETRSYIFTPDMR